MGCFCAPPVPSHALAHVWLLLCSPGPLSRTCSCVVRCSSLSSSQVNVAEPSVADTISILRGLKEKYENHHGVQIEDRALVNAAQLSSRYAPGPHPHCRWKELTRVTVVASM